MKKGSILLLLIMILFSTVLVFSRSGGRIIADPMPTHCEKGKYVELQLFKEIGPDIDDENFMASLTSIAVNPQGDIYVFDGKLKKIFHFDKSFKFVKTIGGPGKGPAEFGGASQPEKHLYCKEDGTLIVCDAHSSRLIFFNREGKAVKHLPYKSDGLPISFFPVMDNNGNLYTTSTNSGAIDVYDKNLNRIHTLLSKTHYDRFLLKEPIHNFKRPRPEINLLPSSGTYYDVTSDNRQIVYLLNGSTAFIFKAHRLIKQFDIWPEILLDKYKKTVEKNSKDKRLRFGVSPVIYDVFADKDEPNFFYALAQGGKNLYKFNLDGDLMAVLQIKTPCMISVKRNNLFYGFSFGLYDSKVRIFKIKENAKK